MTIAEALACGTPVVATAVGGIPELVHSLHGLSGGSLHGHDQSRATGLLVPPGDPGALAAGLEQLLQDDVRRKKLSENAANDACKRFDGRTQALIYLDWYRAMLSRARHVRQPAAARASLGEPLTGVDA